MIRAGLPCPDCGDGVIDAHDEHGRCWECWKRSTDDLFKPNGHQKCDQCGARLTFFGGRLTCVECSGGATVETASTVTGLIEGGPARPPAVDRYAGRFFDLDRIGRLLAEPRKPKKWRVHGLAIDATLTLLAGEAGAGKSILMDNLCSGVAHGRTVAGLPCVKGVALYVDGEMGAEMFFDRYRDTGRDRADFLYLDAMGFDLSVTKPDDLGWLRDQITSVGAQFVVVDSLRRLVPSRSENDSDDMAPALAALAKVARDTGAAVVVIHHKGDGEKFYRGSTAIKDQVDALFGLLHVNPDDDDDRRLRLTCRGARAKAPRSAGEQPDRYLEVSFTDGGVKEADAPEPAGPVVPAREAVASAIKAALPAKTKKEVADKIGRRTDDKTFRDAWNDLKEAGEIVQAAGHWQRGVVLLHLVPGTTTPPDPGVA